jgi:site-specific recombinase XerD
VAILDDYLATIRPACPPSKLLFANPSGYAGTAAYGTYTARACLNLIVRYGTQAGIEGRHHPHRIRHAYATDMLRRGISLEVLRQLLGHESLAITQRYLHLRSDDLSDAVNRVFAL